MIDRSYGINAEGFTYAFFLALERGCRFFPFLSFFSFFFFCLALLLSSVRSVDVLLHLVLAKRKFNVSDFWIF